MANYLVQILYDYHLYGFHNLNVRGELLLGLSFLLFIIPFILLLYKKKSGYVGMIIFLTIEFLFYLVNFVAAVLSGHNPFSQLATHDQILFITFLIGYINLIASGYFLFYFLNNKKIMLYDQK